MRFLLTMMLMLSASSPTVAETVGEMLSNCRPIASAVTEGDMIRYHTTLETQTCWGAFITLQKILIYTDDAKRPFLRACVPPESRRGQLIAVFVDYATKNPQLWHRDFVEVAVVSMQLAFPCK
jgi:hypothetical protein